MRMNGPDRSSRPAARRLVGAAALPAAALLAVLAAALAGCAAVDNGDALVSPNKYTFYTCEELGRRAELVRKRQIELEQVMDRAAQGVGGELVNAIAYRTEYAQTRGELRLLAKKSEEKQCRAQSPLSSGRAVL